VNEKHVAWAVAEERTSRGTAQAATPARRCTSDHALWVRLQGDTQATSGLAFRRRLVTGSQWKRRLHHEKYPRWLGRRAPCHHLQELWKRHDRKRKVVLAEPGILPSTGSSTWTRWSYPADVSAATPSTERSSMRSAWGWRRSFQPVAIERHRSSAQV